MLRKIQCASPLLLMGALFSLSIPIVALAAQTLSPPVTATGTLSTSIFSVTNNGSGSAVQAQSYGSTIQATSQSANGIIGETKLKGIAINNAAGVLGLDNSGGSYNQGVKGTSKFGLGVYGYSAGGYGLVGDGFEGVNAQGYVGVYSTGSGYGSTGTFSSGYSVGVDASANGGPGLGDGVYSYGGNTGVYALGGNYGVTGYGNIVGVSGQNSSSAAGTAVLAQGHSPNGLLYRGQSSSGPNVFTVDNWGNGFFNGQVSATAFVTHTSATVAQATSNGFRVTTFSAQQTAPSVEHVGEANLILRSAVVRFHTAFAATMARGRYMVFITPQGETRGLYVSQKTASGFTVRENQMGRSNAAFDYRVVARPFSTTIHSDVSAPKTWSPGPSIQHPPTIRRLHDPRLTVPQILISPR